MTVRLILVCDGAAYFDDGTPDYTAFVCSETYPAHPRGCEIRADLIENARRAGWKIGPGGDCMCPRCGKPDVRTLRLIDALGATPRAVEP